MTVAAALLLNAASAGSQTLTFPWTLNEVPKGEIVAAIDDGDVLVRVDDLERAGVGGERWERLLKLSRLRRSVARDGAAGMVSLKTLAPLVSFAVDEENVSLAVVFDAALLKPTVIGRRDSVPENLVEARDRAGFLNYSVSTPAFDDFSAFAEIGATLPKGLLYSTFSRAADGPVVRGMTNFTIDQRRLLRRWTMGDAVVATDALGGGGIVTGLTVARNFSLDPYFVRYPGMNLNGTALTPSTVDVYVNGVLVSQQQVPPGPFQLRDVPVSSGAGTTRVVVRDAFGREVVQTADYYYSTSVLAKGLSEYLYSAGALREDFGISSFGSGGPAGVAYHRYGLSDALTIGGRAEAADDLLSGGPALSFRTSFGDFGLLAAGSSADGLSGAAAQIAYRYSNRRFGFGVQARSQSRHYATLSLRPESDRALRDVQMFTSVANRMGSLSLQYAESRMRDLGDTRRASILTSIPLSRRFSLLASVGVVDETGERRGEYFVGTSINLGRGVTANVGATSSGSASNVSAAIHRSLPVGTGFGYRLDTQVGDDGTSASTAAVQYQTTHGRYELAGDPTQSDVKPTLTASGGIILAGGGLHFAQAVQEGFAVVEVPGVSGVRVYASNQLIGRTDDEGRLLIPNLLAYYGNAIRIEDEDIPMSYSVDQVEKTIAPPYRGGAIVVFPVAQHRSITGTVAVVSRGEEAVPALGTLTIQRDGRSWESPLGRGAEFYFENVPPGKYPAAIDYGGGTCGFELTIPEGGTVDVGKVRCIAD